jgi:hypothetical protein
VKGGKSGRVLKCTYGWWSEVHFKICVHYPWSNNIRNYVQYFLPLVLLFPCALLLTVVGLLCIGLLSLSVFLLLHIYYFTMWVSQSYIPYLPDCWLEVSIRKVLRLATSAQFFSWILCAKSECWDGSQDSNLLLHFSHVVPHTTFLDPYFIFMYMHYNHCHRATIH